MAAFSSQFLPKYRARNSRVVDTALETARQVTARDTPIQSGYLAEGTVTERRDESETLLGGVIRNTRNYASYVDDGTQGGQIIIPRRARVLRFSVAGSVVFATRVVRGATPARRFFKEPMPARWSQALADAARADRP